MKKVLAKLTQLQKMLILSALVAVVLLLLSLIPTLILSQPGWIIGIAIGSVIEIFNIFLLYKGSELTIKGRKPIFFVLFYMVRMISFAIGFLLTAFLGFGFSYAGNVLIEPVDAFVNSLWGVLIAYTPLQIVVIIVMFFSKDSPISFLKGKEESK